MLRQFDECRPRFDARTTGFFAIEDNTSCDLVVRGAHDEFLLHYYLLTLNFLLIDTHVSHAKNKKEKSGRSRAFKTWRFKRREGSRGKIVREGAIPHRQIGSAGSLEQGLTSRQFLFCADMLARASNTV
jgi:hypothetical protein